MTTKRILLVDDESALLDGLCRNHRKQYELVAACGPSAGLKAVANDGPFAAVISDFRMPGMNGIEFVTEARELRPDMIPLMLTGQADLRLAIEAVNQGQIFRFMTKPATPEIFRLCVDAAIEQYELRHAEKILLEQTVKGSIEVLSEVLSLCNPQAFGRATRIKGLVRVMARNLGLRDAWRYETAAMLSQIGCVSVPDDIIERSIAGELLPEDQLAIYERHPTFARDLLAKIPRLSEVADMVAAQRVPSRPTATDSVAVRGGRILALALEYDGLIAIGAQPKAAIRALSPEKSGYPEKLVGALRAAAAEISAPAVQHHPIDVLEVGMVLHQDVFNREGELVVGRGHELTQGSLARIKNFVELGHIEQAPLEIRMQRSPSEQRGTAAA